MSYLTCNNKLSHLLPTWMLRAFSSSSRSFCSLSASLRCCSSGSTSLNRPSFMFSLNARSDSVPHIIFTFISSHRCHKVPTIRQPGFDLPRQQWSLLNRFRKEQGHWVSAEGNDDLQTLICVLVARPRRCLTLSNPVP